MKRYPFLRPELATPQEWLPLLDEVYEKGWFTNYGPLSQRLGHELTSYYAHQGYEFVMTSNATAGLTSCLLALKQHSSLASDAARTKVIMPGFTFPATMQAVLAAGLEPLLCDARADDCFIDEARLADLLKEHADTVCAVMPVRAYGFHKPFDSLLQLTLPYEIPVIVDAAAALPATDSGIFYGMDYAPGYFEVFSFHATKVFAVGEGGAICCPQSYVGPLKEAMNFGIKPDKSFYRGVNAKMDEFAAARGLALLVRFDDIIERKKAFLVRYNALFERIGRPDIVVMNRDLYSPYQSLPIFVKDNAFALLEELEKVNIGSRVYYTPSMSEGCVDADASAFPVSAMLSRSMLCLPVYSRYSDEELDDIMARFEQVLNRFSIGGLDAATTHVGSHYSHG